MGGIVAHIMGLLVVALATWGGLVLYKVLNKAKDTVQAGGLVQQGQIPQPSEANYKIVTEAPKQLPVAAGGDIGQYFAPRP